LPDDCPAGVAALEHRESVAAVGHVVAPLHRGYDTGNCAADSIVLVLRSSFSFSRLEDHGRMRMKNEYEATD
jgi:hypothetical protein